MRTGVAFTVSADDQQRLEAIVADRNAVQKHVWRARIILESARGHGTMEIMRRTGKSKACGWRWQGRYVLEGVDELLHDATRPPGRAKVCEVIDLTNSPPDGEATHWTLRAMTARVGLAFSTVRAILDTIERQLPAAREVHVILDNYGTHKTPSVRDWLSAHANWTFHFTPTSSSWLNAVEGFFAKLTKRRLRGALFNSVAACEAAIERFIAEHNSREAKPFKWTADPDRVIAARKRGFQVINSNH